MNNALFLIAIGATNAVVALIIGIVFGDRIRTLTSRAVSSMSESSRSIGDIWVATFVMTRGAAEHRYVEVVRIKQILGVFVGHIEVDDKNYPALAVAASKRPLRLRGELKDNLHFTGLWYHPIDIARYHGAFQLVISPDGKTMSGRWLGYSETLRDVDTGTWHFERVLQQPSNPPPRVLGPAAQNSRQSSARV